MATDLLIYESNGNGGDLLQVGNDLATVNGVENQPYLACFGGANDGGSWWADNLLHQGRDSVHMRSQTEKTLNSVALNSAGRLLIEEAVKQDLKFMQDILPGTQLRVTAVIEDTDRLRLEIDFAGQQIVLYWIAGTDQLYEPQARGAGINYWIIEYDFVVS